MCVIIYRFVMRAYIHIFIYKNSVILYTVTPTKSLSTLLPQGFATFGFYAKHMYNLYYTPVFGTPSCGKPGVFSDEPNENRKKTGCCTHTNTSRNSPTLPKPHPLLSIFPCLRSHSPLLSSSPPPILFIYQSPFPLLHVTVANIYSFYTVVSTFS